MLERQNLPQNFQHISTISYIIKLQNKVAKSALMLISIYKHLSLKML
jgi:hypothetical protein